MGFLEEPWKKPKKWEKNFENLEIGKKYLADTLIVFRGRWKFLHMRAIENFAINEFFIGLWESGEEWSWLLEPFSKLKTIFCKYWTLIEIRINMECTKSIKLKWKWHNNNDSAKKLKIMFLLG